MTVLDRIRAEAKKKGFSITTLELALGYSNGSISKPKDIPSSRIRDIAALLNISTDYLLTGEDTRIDAPEFSDDQFEVLSIYAQLNDKQKEAVLSMLRSMIL